MWSEMGNYTASWIVHLCHSFPHLSFSFAVVDKEDYAFDNNSYLESLAVIALMVIVWFLLTLIVFVIYFCCLKGSGDKDTKYNSSGCSCSLCVLAILLMLTLGGIGAAVYGNMQASDGVDAAAGAVHSGNHTFFVLHTKVVTLVTESTRFRDMVTELKGVRSFDSDVLELEEMAYKMTDAINPFSVQLEGVEDRLAWSIGVLVVAEEYRNIATLCLLGLQCFVCLLGLLGLCCRSKCILIFMIVLGMICITLTYFYVAVDLVINVSASDFCIHPYIAIYNQTVQKAYMGKEVADYFLKCEANPFKKDIDDGREALAQAVMLIETIDRETNNTDEKDTLVVINDSIENFVSGLDDLDGELDCKPVKSAMGEFVPAICVTTVDGLFALSAAMLGIGIFMSLAMCAAAKTGKQFGKHFYDSDSDADLDFNDPFLPRHTSFNARNNRSSNITRTNNPIYATTASGNSNYGVATNTLSFFRPGSEEDVSLIENPPPYSPPRPGGSRYSN